MKMCENCNKPIEVTLLENNKATTVCGRCRGLAVNEFYNIIKTELQTCNLESEDKKRLERRLLERTKEISKHYRKSLDEHEEQVKRTITTQLQVETNKLESEKRMFEQEKSCLENARNKFLAEQEELVGKNHKLAQEQFYLEQKVQFLSKELNSCIINRYVSNIQNDQIILYVNPERKTERSPLVIGRAMVRNNSYDVVIWANLDKNGHRYWAGYLNDVNGYMDGKENNRRIWFKKTEDASILSGAVSFDDVERSIKLNIQKYGATNLIYWTGQVLKTISAK